MAVDEYGGWVSGEFCTVVPIMWSIIDGKLRQTHPDACEDMLFDGAHGNDTFIASQ